MRLLKRGWRMPVMRAVTAPGIVEHLDVVEDILPDVVPACAGLALDALAFYKLEAVTCDCLVFCGENF